MISLNQIRILEIPFTLMKEEDIINTLLFHLSDPNSPPLFLATPNPEILLISKDDPEYKNILNKTDLNIPDGNGIIWANYFLSKVKKYHSKFIIGLTGIGSIFTFLFHPKNNTQPFNKAIHGSDLMQHICLDSEFAGHKIFLLGNVEGLMSNTAEIASQRLKELNPEVQIAGYFDSTTTSQVAVQKINESGAEIVFVAFGAPAQEIWIANNLKDMPKVKLIMGVGGSFDFIAGIIPRAPSWMRSFGLEWAYRLIKQPIKRAKRIYNALVVFPYTVIKNRLF